MSEAESGKKDLKDFLPKRGIGSRQRDHLSAYDIATQGEKIKEIALFMLEKPEARLSEIAQNVNMTQTACKQLMQSNKYLMAMRSVATSEMTQMLSMALNGLKECLTSASQTVKLNACVKVLENEGIIGPTRMDISVSDLRSQPIEKINRIIEMGQRLADQTIMDAEVIQ